MFNITEAPPSSTPAEPQRFLPGQDEADSQYVLLAQVHKIPVVIRKLLQVTGWSAVGQVCSVEGGEARRKDCPLRCTYAVDEQVRCTILASHTVCSR